jgi:phosphoenolpyruvate---glycerone phosphotransferase subunit DhaL
MSREPSIGDVVVAVADGLTEARDLLNRLDAVAGDGDLGLTAGRAAEALVELAPTLADLPPGDALNAIGMALARRAPSTGGTLLAFACLAAARVSPAARQTQAASIADLLDAARDEIARRGKVEPGDRTMLDALAPATTALREAAEAGSDVWACLAAAAAAADRGATSTIDMDATTGRAGWLAERARGHEDAGARLIAVIFSAAAGASRSAGGRPTAPRRSTPAARRRGSR